MSTTLSIGKKAPDFTLSDENKDDHSLSDYLGKWVLVYFYPKDNTPGCTIEAQALRDENESYNKENIVVLGVSKDTASSHKKFKEGYKLPFTLLVDKDKKLADTYGVLSPKRFMGREYMGVNRYSFLIDPDGILRKIYTEVVPIKHAKEVLEDVRKFQN